ncbi:MAG: serine/threonine-protein kinase [Myxococcota bacterium]
MRETKPIETVVRERDAMLESQVGDYILEALIGEGSAAKVYRARSLSTGQLSAIKLLSREVGANHALVERMRREAEALGRIEHPNVVRTYEFGRTPEGRPYLVMELIRGVTLSSIIAEDAPLPRRRFAELARQMAAGLWAAHESGIVHRDLKPSNVLVSSSNTAMPRVKLVDFGLVRGLGGSNLGATDRSLTDHHALLGTPLYMAPEQLMNPREAKPTSDLYALGVIFYEMLSGKVPFDGPIMSVFEQHFRAAPPPLTTRTGFEALVFALLQKSPMDRPPSAEAVVDALDVLAEPTGEITRVAAHDEEPTGRLEPARHLLMGDEETTGAAEPRAESLPPLSFEGPTDGSFNALDPTMVDRETDASMQATSVGVHREELKGTRILVEEDFVTGGETELDAGGEREPQTVVEQDPRDGPEEVPTAFDRPPRQNQSPAPFTGSLPGILVQPVLDEALESPRLATPEPLNAASPDEQASIDLHDTLVPGQVRRSEVHESALLAPRPVVIKKPPTPLGVKIVREPPASMDRPQQIRVTHAAPRGMRVVTGLAILCALFLVAFALTMRLRASGHDLRDIVIPAVGSSTTG